MTPEGEVRHSRRDRGVNFSVVVTERVEHASMRWRYVFDERSFPAGSIDEHVANDRRYFDLRDTTFHLQPLPGGGTRLKPVALFRVTTPINAYAVPAAALLGRDFVDTLPGLYKGRSGRAVAGPT